MPNSNSQIHRGRPLQPGVAISRRDYNATRAAIRGAHGVNGITVELTPRGMRLGGRFDAGLNLSKFAFGWVSASGASVTVRGGYVIGFDAVAEIADATVACGGTEAVPHLIVASGAVDPVGGSILANSILKSSFTGHTATEFVVPLYEVYLNARGVAVMKRVHHVGSPIDLKHWVGP